jgi:hypothetical protein
VCSGCGAIASPDPVCKKKEFYLCMCAGVRRQFLSPTPSRPFFCHATLSTISPGYPAQITTVDSSEVRETSRPLGKFRKETEVFAVWQQCHVKFCHTTYYEFKKKPSWLVSSLSFLIIIFYCGLRLSRQQRRVVRIPRRNWTSMRHRQDSSCDDVVLEAYDRARN